MTTHCFIPVLGKRIRVTPLDSCGALISGGKYVATDGFISVSLSSEIEDGTEIITKKASGALCVNEKYADSFKRFTVEIEFCGVNPSLLALVTNAKAYNDYAGDAAGFTVAEGAINKWFALELWTGMSGVACAPGAEEASGYILLPFVTAGVLGDITVDGENAVTFTLTGAATKGGNQWGRGPYSVVKNVAQGINEVQTVTISGTPTGGAFKLTYKGQTTADIAYNAAAAAVDAALEALSTIGVGNVAVTGGPGPGTPYVVTFGGALAGQNVTDITATHTFTGGTTPGVTIANTTPGVSPAAILPTALDAYDHFLLIDTAVAPPPSACEPTTVPVKGAAAPGSVYVESTVTAQDAPNAAKLGPLGYVAAPTTNWTSGQAITVSGFFFNWTGSAWAAGVHA